MLVLGVAVFVAVAVGAIGDMMLQRVETDLTQARLPSGLASLDRLVDQGGATVSPVIGADGRVVGMVVMQKGAGPAVIPASLVPQGSVQRAAVPVEPATDATAIAEMRKTLMVASALVLLVVGFVGMQMARNFAEPLGRLATQVDKLAAGDTGIKIAAPLRTRTDEVGRLARATMKLEDRIVELERLATRRGTTAPTASASGGGMVTAIFREMWSGLAGLFGMAGEGRPAAKTSGGGRPAAKKSEAEASPYWDSFKSWLTDDRKPVRPRTA
ncbi:histidine kinase, HAMP region domain protein [Rhodovulum sp. PH10]|nr:histidine kinase, HAMP region domain protein [Rhodovulum sp. PH10]